MISIIRRNINNARAKEESPAAAPGGGSVPQRRQAGRRGTLGRRPLPRPVRLPGSGSNPTSGPAWGRQNGIGQKPPHPRPAALRRVLRHPRGRRRLTRLRGLRRDRHHERSPEPRFLVEPARTPRVGAAEGAPDQTPRCRRRPRDRRCVKRADKAARHSRALRQLAQIPHRRHLPPESDGPPAAYPQNEQCMGRLEASGAQRDRSHREPRWC